MTVRVKFWLYRYYPTKIKTFCDIIISRVVFAHRWDDNYGFIGKNK